jgi:pilus assembly protein Flp/PilA
LLEPTFDHQPFFRSTAVTRFSTAARSFVRDEDGAALVEYGLLVLLIAVLCIVAVQTIGSKVSNSFNSAGSQIP